MEGGIVVAIALATASLGSIAWGLFALNRVMNAKQQGDIEEPRDQMGKAKLYRKLRRL
jgi:hypothetical protein